MRARQASASSPSIIIDGCAWLGNSRSEDVFEEVFLFDVPLELELVAYRRHCEWFVGFSLKFITSSRARCAIINFVYVCSQVERMAKIERRALSLVGLFRALCFEAHQARLADWLTD